MAATCPFTDKACNTNGCQLWVTDGGTSRCAFVDIAVRQRNVGDHLQSLANQLPKTTKAIQDAVNSMSDLMKVLITQLSRPFS